MNLFEQILTGKAEQDEVNRLKQGMTELQRIQAVIDKMPDGKSKIGLQKELNSATKQLSEREKKTAPKEAPKPSAVATPPPQQPAQNQQAKKQGVPPPAEEAPKPSAVATPPQPQAAAQPQAPAPQQPAAQPAQKAEAPTDEEKTMLQKLHKSSYDPNSSTDKRNLEILRQARQEVGKDANLKTLANAVYGKQYSQKKGTVNVQPTAQQSAPASAPAPQLNAQNVPSVQAVQQMKAPQEPFKMQAPQQTGTLAQGPTNAAAAAQQAQKQQTAQQPAVAPQQQAPTKAAESTPNPFIRDLSKVGSALSKSVQNMYGGANKSQQQVASNQKPAKPEAAEEEANEENCEDCENNCEKCKKNKSNALNKITVQEKVNISKFLKHLSEKNYSSAHKYLKAIVDDKVNAKIAQRIAKI